MRIPERTQGSIIGLDLLCRFLKKQLPLDRAITILEIGSWTGISALVFAKHFDRVICVDPWEKTVDEISSEYDMREVEKIFDTRIKNKNISKLKMKSEQAVFMLEDNSLDAVYIDGSHKYEEVKKDVILWLPKIKKSGFICGHDMHYLKFPGVTKAVIELIGNQELHIFPDTSWCKEKCKVKGIMK